VKRGLWRYRVGDFRLICSIEDGQLVVLFVINDLRTPQSEILGLRRECL